MRYIPLENHPADSRLKIIVDDTCQTLSGRMGTGGGNVPMVMVVPDDFDTTKISGCNNKRYGDMLHP